MPLPVLPIIVGAGAFVVGRQAASANNDAQVIVNTAPAQPQSGAQSTLSRNLLLGGVAVSALIIAPRLLSKK